MSRPRRRTAYLHGNIFGYAAELPMWKITSLEHFSERGSRYWQVSVSLQNGLSSFIPAIEPAAAVGHCDRQRLGLRDRDVQRTNVLERCEALSKAGL